MEILYFEGCPNYEETIARVERVSGGVTRKPEICLVEVPDADTAVALGFLGSPTVRVDGRDIEPGADERQDFVFGCRVYRDSEGYRGYPSAALIRDALEAAGS